MYRQWYSPDKRNSHGPHEYAVVEGTESCKRINQNEMALLDHKGTIVLVLQHINLR